jgi:putative endonuclease
MTNTLVLDLMLTNYQIAKAGEDAAVKLLEEKGYSIVCRNYDLPMGELDIVASKDGKIYFVEVKTSLDTHRTAFSPEDRVNKRKRQTLQNLCETYLLREGVGTDTEWQIDVVSVTLDKEGKSSHIEHIENAIWDYRGI